jgi:RNA polymerase sigma factor (sigma-70 family)
MQSYSYSLDPTRLWSLVTTLVTSFISKSFPGSFTHEDIEDIIGDVVYTILKKAETYDPAKGAIESWAWRIARNAVIDAANAKKKRPGFSGSIEKDDDNVYVLPIHYDSADGEFNRRDLEQNLLKSLRNERDKRFLRYLLDDLDRDEIASREGISVNAVNITIYRLRQQLNRIAG